MKLSLLIHCFCSHIDILHSRLIKDTQVVVRWQSGMEEEMKVKFLGKTFGTSKRKITRVSEKKEIVK